MMMMLMGGAGTIGHVDHGKVCSFPWVMTIGTEAHAFTLDGELI